MRAVQTIIATAFLCGCASSHNLATDGMNVFGGGYIQSKVSDGIFQISVKTNWAPWVNTSAAKSSWRDRATELCGSEKFRELEIREGNYDQLSPYGGVIRYIVTTRDGFAVCDNANLTDEAALALIHKR
jgi:hypothetical protein